MNRNLNLTKLRAVGYNRVSSDELEQVDALQVQIKETQEHIAKMGWVMVDQYIDEGKSGTATKKRNEYNRLFNDLSTNNFDIVVIKSQDRLMRNTKDWYLFIDALVKNNKKLYMYIENKFYTPDDALITGIRAILAEEFSRDMSKKQNNAHRRRQQLGTNAVINSKTWGYNKINKEVVINEKEAEIVRTIFNMCLQGYGSRSIAKELENLGVRSRTNSSFSDLTVRRILRNPLFMGTVVMNKTHMDFETKKTIYNPPEEWIYHENMIPAIVSKDTWEKAQILLDKRSQEKIGQLKTKRRYGLNTGKYNLSSKIVCGICGETYWRKPRRVKSGYTIDWVCAEYVKNGRKTNKRDDKKNILKIFNNIGCDNRHIKDSDLMCIIEKLSYEVYGDRREQIIKHATKLLEQVLGEDDSINKFNKLVSDKTKYLTQKNILMDKLLDGTITDSDFKRRNADLDNKLAYIENELINIDEKYNIANNVSIRLEDIKKCLNDKGTTRDAQVINLIKHIDRIIIYENYMEIYFDFLERIKINDKNDINKHQYANTSKHLISHTDGSVTEYQFVDTSKYLISHTVKGKFISAIVKIYV